MVLRWVSNRRDIPQPFPWSRRDSFFCIQSAPPSCAIPHPGPVSVSVPGSGPPIGGQLFFSTFIPGRGHFCCERSPSHGQSRMELPTHIFVGGGSSPASRSPLPIASTAGRLRGFPPGNAGAEGGPPSEGTELDSDFEVLGRLFPRGCTTHLYPKCVRLCGPNEWQPKHAHHQLRQSCQVQLLIPRGTGRSCSDHFEVGQAKYVLPGLKLSWKLPRFAFEPSVNLFLTPTNYHLRISSGRGEVGIRWR